MAGRTMDVSTSSFKPLDLQEIMMVPLAKQKMEDEFMASSDQMGALEAGTLISDAKRADGILGGFKDQASALSQDVIDRGVSREQFNKLRRLRADTQKEFSSGFLASAMANKKAASEYINKMTTDKVAQAGWSPKEAQQWAVHNVKEFKGTQAADGSYNSFQGKQLATKVDEDKFLKEAVDSVAKDIDAVAMNAINVGGLDGFRRAFESGTITKVDFNKVMETIMLKSSTNPALLNSLTQQAFFTGEKDPLKEDFLGKFEYKDEKVFDEAGNPVLDKDGKQRVKTVRNFKVGDTRFGRKAAGFANAASYSNRKINTTIIKDEIAAKMYEENMQEEQAVQLVQFLRGELNGITADNLDAVENNLKLYGTEVNALHAKASKRKQDLLDAGTPESEIKNDFEYQRLENLYIDKNTSFKNAQSRIKSIYKQVDNKVKPDDKRIFEVQDVLSEYGGDPIRALKEEFGQEVGEEWLKGGLNRDEEAEAAYMLAKEMGVNMDVAGRYRPNHNVWKDVYKGAKDRRGELTEQYLEANPKSEYFTRINGESVGKHYTAIGGWNKTQSENFSAAGSTLAYNGGTMEENEDYQNILVEGEIPKFRVELTDGTDDAGNSFNNVIVTTSKGSTSVQIIDNENGSARAKIANQLLKGDYRQRKLGKQMLADMNHMRQIKKSGMLWQDEGFMSLNLGDGKSRKDVKYVKNPDNGFFEVTIGGIPIDLNGRTQLAGEKEVSLALASAVTQINLRKEKLAQKQKEALKAK